MHTIEPFYNWINLYDPTTDERSPFFNRSHHEFLCSHTVYNYYIHPQWDEFGSSTLYLKLLFTDYEAGFCIVELLGEWNDCLYNDIMFLKRNFSEPLIEEGIKKFILIGENVLNFHASENDYYQEWAEEVENGWVVLLNIRNHVGDEFRSISADRYMAMGGVFNHINWRTMHPFELYKLIDQSMVRKLSNLNVYRA